MSRVLHQPHLPGRVCTYFTACLAVVGIIAAMSSQFYSPSCQSVHPSWEASEEVTEMPQVVRERWRAMSDGRWAPWRAPVMRRGLESQAAALRAEAAVLSKRADDLEWSARGWHDEGDENWKQWHQQWQEEWQQDDKSWKVWETLPRKEFAGFCAVALVVISFYWRWYSEHVSVPGCLNM